MFDFLIFRFVGYDLKKKNSWTLCLLTGKIITKCLNIKSFQKKHGAKSKARSTTHCLKCLSRGMPLLMLMEHFGATMPATNFLITKLITSYSTCRLTPGPTFTK